MRKLRTNRAYRKTTDNTVLGVFLQRLVMLLVLGVMTMSSLYGQEIIKAEYFLETDPGVGNGIEIPITSGNAVGNSIVYDAQNLKVGKYLLYIRVMNDLGIWSKVENVDILIKDTTNNAVYNSISTPIIEAEYFVDTDPGPGNGTAIAISSGDSVSQSFNLNANGILPGNHMGYVRVKDEMGIWAMTQSFEFFVNDTTSTNVESQPIIAAEYYIDTDPGVGKAIAIPVERAFEQSGVATFSTAGLTYGEHKAFVRVLSESGVWSVANEAAFAVMPSSGSYPIAAFTTDTVAPGTATSFTNLSDSVDSSTTYVWDVDGDGVTDYTSEEIEHVFDASGYYTVSLTVANDTLTSVYKGVVVVSGLSSSSIASNGSTTICEGDSVQLTAPESSSYEWSTGETTQNIWVKDSGNYYAWLTDNSAVSVKSNGMTVNVVDSVDLTLDISATVENESVGSVQLTVNNYDLSELDYSWSTGITNQPYLNELSAGDYYITVNNGVCVQKTDFSIDSYTSEDEDIVASEYFWDTDPGVGNGTALPVSAGGQRISHQFAIETTGLDAGNHRLFIRTKAGNEIWSMSESVPVIIKEEVTSAIDQNITAAEYFVDTDPGVGNGTAITVSAATKSLDGVVSLAQDDYESGDHILYIRVKSDNNIWSHYATQAFQVCDVLPAVPTTDNVAVCYGASVTLTVTGEEGNTFLWYDADGILIDGETESDYTLSNVVANDTLYVAQVDASGCISDVSEIDVKSVALDVFAGLDETISKAGQAYQVASFYPSLGSWSGSSMDADGLITRNSFSANTYTYTYSVDSMGCTFKDTKDIEVVDLSETDTIYMDENPLNGTVLVSTSYTNVDSSYVYSGTAESIDIDAYGVISVADSSYYDYETNSSMDWVVHMVESKQLTHEIILNVLLNDVDEAATSIEDGEEQIALLLYPNPTSGDIYIKRSNVEAGDRIEVVDISGHVLYTQDVVEKSTYINLSGYNEGIYFIKYINDKQSVVKKIVLN